jgi:8-oxo-dGTP pyrophosphatase MutT (NUDIX family)
VIQIVAAVFERDGKLLFGLRAPSKQWLPNAWDLIGGHVEAGETPEETLKREVAEELAVRVTAAEPLMQETYLREDGERVLQHVFRVTAWEGDLKIANDEHTQLGWFGEAEAKALPNLAAQEYLVLFPALRRG